MDEQLKRRRRRTPFGGLALGGLVVLAGVLLLLDNLGIVEIQHIWRFWPVFLVGLGLSRALSSSGTLARIWGGGMIALGVLFLLDNFRIMRLNFNLVWPLFVIFVGLSMLSRVLGPRRSGQQCGVSTDSDVNLVGIFSGGRQRIDSKQFQGCDIFTLCGGFEVDLRNATLAEGKAVVEINAIFGGVELRVPETWSVLMKGVGIFGGFEDKTVQPQAGDTAARPELTVTGSAIFGGASVRN